MNNKNGSRSNNSFCSTCVLITFSARIVFLWLVYRFYLPALSGSASALFEAARKKLAIPERV